MTLVVPLGKSAFEFFDKDRQVIHPSAIAIQQAPRPPRVPWALGLRRADGSDWTSEVGQNTNAAKGL